jgi:C4-dicarboxylate-specific signal transduction histidine kinase
VSKCKDPEKARAMIDHLLDKHHMDIECDSLDLQKIMFLHETGKPVHRAVYSRNLDVLQHLLLRGADPESGMEVAIGNCIYSNNFLPALGPLLQAGADPNRALSQAIRQKDIEAARICLDHGAEVMLAIEEQRARAVRVRARREAEMNNRPDESDPDGVYYDSHSSQEDEDEIKERKEIEEFLRSVQGAR